MKNFLLIFAVFSLSFNSLNAQDQIYWTEVALEVIPGKAPLVYKLVDDFYSSIEFPEDASLTLNAIQNKSEWTNATHFLNFAGSPDALAELRELRTGNAYDSYVTNLQGLAKIVAMKQGQSLIRIQGENGSYSEQMWSFYVDDPGTFAQAFIELNKGFSNSIFKHSLFSEIASSNCPVSSKIEHLLFNAWTFLGLSSIDLRVLCYSNPVGFTDFSKIKQNLIFEIIKIVRSNGSEFAYPSRSIYIENNDGLDVSKYLTDDLSEKISNDSNPQQGED